MYFAVQIQWVDYFWYSSTILYYTILVFSFLSLIVVEQWSQLLLSSTAVEREVPLGTSAVVSYYSACEESPETFMTTSELQYRVSKQVLNNHIPKLIKSGARSDRAKRLLIFFSVLESRQSNSKAHFKVRWTFVAYSKLAWTPCNSSRVEGFLIFYPHILTTQ